MLVFLKLGGSLITNKEVAFSACVDVIERLAEEIKQALDMKPDLHIILGHGSGSFGHTAADRYKTHLGVTSASEWEGFIEVARQADRLHRIVMDILWDKGLNAISFPPSATAHSHAHQEMDMEVRPIAFALEHNLLPVVFGDVAFDTQIGGTILSTEDVLKKLCQHFPIQRILEAGKEVGVWKSKDDPEDIFTKLTPQTYQKHIANIGASGATDVTGGMRAKVETLFEIMQNKPDMEALIFSGLEKENVQQALLGKEIGTVLNIR